MRSLPWTTRTRRPGSRPTAGHLGAALVLVALAACRGPSIPATTRAIAPGVWHHAVELIEGPWAIHVIEVDLPVAWRAGIRLTTARAPVAGGLERTSALAGDAVAAVNGDFFFDSTPIHSSGVQVVDGELLEEPRPRSAFAITEDGRPIIAVLKMRAGLITRSGHALKVSHLNREPRGADELTVFSRYAQAWRDSVRAPVGYYLQPLDSTTNVINDTLPARVVQVRRLAWPLKLQPGQWLIAGGADFAQVQTISPGDTVQLYFMLPPTTTALREAIGGGPRIVRDGRVSIEHQQESLSASFAVGRHPRTAVGYSQDGSTLFLVTIDGRQPGHSVGMSLQELAELMTVKLPLFTESGRGAHQALNLDGGGSTTMVVRRQVVNRPSNQTGERPVANAILLVRPTGSA